MANHVHVGNIPLPGSGGDRGWAPQAQPVPPSTGRAGVSGAGGEAAAAATAPQRPEASGRGSTTPAAQDAGESTEEGTGDDCDYQTSRHPAAGPLDVAQDSVPDMVRTLELSKTDSSPAMKSEVEFDIDLRRAIEESRRSSHQSAAKEEGDDGVIELLSSDDDEDASSLSGKKPLPRKPDHWTALATKPEATTVMPLKKKRRRSFELSETCSEFDDERGRLREDDAKMPARKRSPSRNSGDDQSRENADLKEAIRLSLQPDDVEPMIKYRVLSREEFEKGVNAVVDMNGGLGRIERSSLIQQGNSNDMSKEFVPPEGGKNQTGAQYGRVSIDCMYRIVDVLEGRVSAEQDDFPTAPIKAFLDIGHGLGIQGEVHKRAVRQFNQLPLQLTRGSASNGLEVSVPLLCKDLFKNRCRTRTAYPNTNSHGVLSRGCEIMKGRDTLSKHIMRDGLLDWTRNDPCDLNTVDLRWLGEWSSITRVSIA